MESSPPRTQPHTVKCRNVSHKHRKLLAELETDLGDATHGEALEVLLDVYEQREQVVFNTSARF